MNRIGYLMSGLTLVASTGLFGCGENGTVSENTSIQEKAVNKEPNRNIEKKNRSYFKDWGIIEKLELEYEQHASQGMGYSRDDLEISLGDLDGDGDLDIVVGSRTTGLRIYENRIPQKSH